MLRRSCYKNMTFFCTRYNFLGGARSSVSITVIHGVRLYSFTLLLYTGVQYKVPVWLWHTPVQKAFQRGAAGMLYTLCKVFVRLSLKRGQCRG